MFPNHDNDYDDSTPNYYNYNDRATHDYHYDYHYNGLCSSNNHNYNYHHYHDHYNNYHNNYNYDCPTQYYDYHYCCSISGYLYRNTINTRFLFRNN